jgi:UDP-N-acetylglucosamine 2-epimerase
MIAFILCDRANYGRLKPVMRACVDAGLDVSAICGGSMVLPRFERPADMVRADGFHVSQEVYCEIEGGNRLTMAKSVGESTKAFAQAIGSPQLAVIIGDRYEALGAATACHYVGVPLLHLQGGEISGTLDNGARNAITALATWHWPATSKAATRVAEQIGSRVVWPHPIKGNISCYQWEWRGKESHILGIGCPSTDLLAGLDNTPGDYILACYHPDTHHPETASAEVAEMLAALEGQRTVFMWPNIDAGSHGIGMALHRHRKAPWLRRVVNMSPEQYYRTMAQAKCLVGNSSSFVRDSAILGVPAVIVGTRQDGRERGSNVASVPADARLIAESIKLQPARYEACHLFGDGQVSGRIAAAIKALAQREKAA